MMQRKAESIHIIRFCYVPPPFPLCKLFANLGSGFSSNPPRSVNLGTGQPIGDLCLTNCGGTQVAIASATGDTLWPGQGETQVLH